MAYSYRSLCRATSGREEAVALLAFLLSVCWLRSKNRQNDVYPEIAVGAGGSAPGQVELLALLQALIIP